MFTYRVLDICRIHVLLDGTFTVVFVHHHKVVVEKNSRQKLSISKFLRSP